MKETPAKDLEKFIIRMPNGLRDRIKLAAEKNNRSMNAEVVATLEDAYPEHDFDFGSFMLTWMVPITKATSESERQTLIEGANNFLSTLPTDARLVTERTRAGKVDVILVMGGVRMLVGDAQELTLLD
ncbi:MULTISPECIES: Arc family DNA-binding protein [Pseudomonadota]|uniref:Arc family DNA-binding protein n=1 Tax=Pseudomonadota TaxID=1224 RepID=UPI0013776835|nr:MULTISPECIES: Arc family DNA-binding protein [Pseudomonadota]NBB07890.1 Arc family DNA-binding protein [Pseudomonas monteilii]NTB01102.1 Arc family DNA-binding protein [Agrobacterium tumefaciens]